MNVGITSRGEDTTGQQAEADPEGDVSGPNGRRPGARTGIAGLLDPARDLARRVMREGRSTPGKLSGLAVVIVVLAMVVAVVGAVVVTQRGDTTERLTEHREPLAVAAQELYSALSEADVTVARSFLVTDDQRDVVRERYEADIEDAGTALAQAASDASTVPGAAERISVLTKKLPVYTGLVEQARAERRAAGQQDGGTGAESGEQELREASELMRSQLLPAAQKLYQINTAQLENEQRHAASFPWLLLTLVSVLLAVLLAAQVYLRRRTNRVFNIGLVVATGAVVVMVLWGTAGITVQSVFVNRGSGTTAQEDTLVHARITALRARGDEMFMLLSEDENTRYREEFAEMSQQLAGADGSGGLLERVRDESGHENTSQRIEYASNSARSWLGIHDTIEGLVTEGARQRAVELATDTHDGGGSTATFTRLNRHLSKAIDSEREHFRDDISTASNALTLLASGIVFLSAATALAATIGLRDRIREYR